MTSVSDDPSGGTGLLAVFCDLEEADRGDFRPWLTEDMFPARRAIGFSACASYDKVEGDGQQFLTLYEMPSLGYLYGEPYQALRGNRDPRDAAYHEKFRNPDRYTLSWSGPELVCAGVEGLAPYARVERFSLDAKDAQAFNMSFVAEHLQALADHPAVVRVRRYLSMEGAPAHVVLSEFSAPPASVPVLPAEARSLQSAVYCRVAKG